MGKPFIDGTRAASLYKWGANAEFRNQVKEVKKRGRPVGTTKDFVLNNDPRTPFEALRMLLRVTMTEWSEMLETSTSAISHIDRGNGIASVPLAKRMQEEARKRGVAVTLDELYQHVVPWGVDVEPPPQ